MRFDLTKASSWVPPALRSQGTRQPRVSHLGDSAATVRLREKGPASLLPDPHPQQAPMEDGALPEPPLPAQPPST